jgi:hypothetical protein
MSKEIVKASELAQLTIDTYFSNGFNGTQAVKQHRPELNYMAAANVWQNILRSKNNKAYIEEKRNRLKASTDIQNENILRELINWAYVDATEFINLTAEEIKELPSDIKRCIQSFRHKKKTYHTKNDGEITEELIEVKLIDKHKAIESINKHLGFYAEDNQQKGNRINVLQVLQESNPDTLNTLLQAMENNDHET